jgi:hypothetical protein
MMAGLLIISMISGAAASVVALAMSQPFWVALAAYPIAGTITLFSAAVLLGLRASNGSRQAGFGRLSAAPVRAPH